jgi:hypothetical protein
MSKKNTKKKKRKQPPCIYRGVFCVLRGAEPPERYPSVGWAHRRYSAVRSHRTGVLKMIKKFYNKNFSPLTPPPPSLRSSRPHPPHSAHRSFTPLLTSLLTPPPSLLHSAPRFAPHSFTLSPPSLTHPLTPPLTPLLAPLGCQIQIPICRTSSN